jgi:hypothetical protein
MTELLGVTFPISVPKGWVLPIIGICVAIVVVLVGGSMLVNRRNRRKRDDDQR